MKKHINDFGFVELVDTMGSAASVVNAARVSFGKRIEGGLSDKDKSLIKYLWTHKHTSPFRHAFFTFHIKAPIFVIRQWQKHQVGCSWNEISGRYVKLDHSIHCPDVWRKSIKNVKQGSGGAVDNQDEITDLYLSACNYAYATYKEMLKQGVAREQARMILPLAQFTECYWSASLHAVIHFLQLRLAKDAQAEIRYYAQAIKALVESDESFSFIMDVCLNEY